MVLMMRTGEKGNRDEATKPVKKQVECSLIVKDAARRCKASRW
jgi:hypothetical protein